MTLEELLNALGHDRFHKLVNNQTHWQLVFEEGTGFASIQDKHLDRLLQKWCEMLEAEAAIVSDTADTVPE